MPCATCQHTIQRVNDGDNPRVFWCPRCGTIKLEGGVPESEEPMLVARCRAVDASLTPNRTNTASPERAYCVARQPIRAMREALGQQHIPVD